MRIIIVEIVVTVMYNPHPSGRPIREVLVEELSRKMDFDRVHFLGRYLILNISCFASIMVHIYLSYPFVLGWSSLRL